MSSESEWRWADPRGQQRLVRTDELRAGLVNGSIASNAPVWRRGWKEWRPAYDVPELQIDALAAANGTVPNLPPPPRFVAAPHTMVERRHQVHSLGESPPPPPRYVPAAASHPTISSAPPPAHVTPHWGSPGAVVIPPFPKSPTNIMGMNTPPAKKTMVGIVPPHRSGTAQGPATPGRSSPAPSSGTTRAGLGETSSTSSPPPSGSEHLKRAVPVAASGGSSSPSSAGRARSPGTEGSRHDPMILEPEPSTSVDLKLVSDKKASETGGRSDAIPPPRDGVRTVVGVPVIQDPRAAKARVAAAAERAAAERAAKLGDKPAKATEKSASVGKPKRSTLILYGGAPVEGEEASPRPPDSRGSAPPIVVPGPPSPTAGKNAVTRPPPWGEGAVEIGPAIPKSPPLPRLHNESVEELSGSMLVEQTDEGPMVRHLSPSRPPPAVQRTSGIPPRGSRTSGAPAAGVPAASAPAAGAAGGTLVGIGVPRSDESAIPAARTSERTRVATPAATRTAPMPVSAPSHGSVRLAAAPEAPLSWMKPLLDKWPALERAQRGKPRFFLPMVFALGLLVVLIGFGALVKALLPGERAKVAEKSTKEPGPRVAMTTTGSAAVAAVSPTEKSGEPAAKPGASEKTGAAVEKAGAGAATPEVAAPPCTLVGRTKSMAPQVLVASGVEVVPTSQGVAFGFASGPKEAVSMLVDPGTLSAVADHTTKSADLIRRVTPIPSDAKSPLFAASTDRKGDAIEARRTSSGPSPIDLGVAAGHLVWASHKSDKPAQLWPLAGDGPVEALRAVPLGASERGYALTFRRGASIWAGVISGEKSFVAKGDLVETKGLGPQVGSPSIAASGDAVLVLWADRASPDEPWALRTRRWRTGETPEAAKSFAVPAGGLGAPYMSPSVAPLGDGRFLVVWTEGPVSSHQVRALTLDATGQPQGSPLTVSSEGANAGQGQAAVMADGRGAVAYLVAADGGGFQLMATSITCPRP